MCQQSACRRMMGLIGVYLAAASLSLSAEPAQDNAGWSQSGYIVPVRQVTLSPGVAGHVFEVRIEPGQLVQTGEVLARLDPAEYEAAFRITRAELALAEARFRKAEESNAKADLAIAKAEIEIAQARVQRAQLRLDHTIIRAPFSGTILDKRVEIGAFLNPAGFQVPASLCDLADLTQLEVEVFVTERDWPRLAVDQPCKIVADAYPQTTYQGKVVRLLPVADRARGTLTARVRIENPAGDGKLRPEMRAVVQFQTKK